MYKKQWEARITYNSDMKHVLTANQFDRKTLETLFRSARALEQKRVNALKGKILATLFFEPSTRTRLSFESAMLRMGGGVISTENAKEFSSATKGETLHDTIRVVSQYADVIALRHFEKGAVESVAEASSVPLINAGDGAGEHPTQALLDAYTILRERGAIDGAHVAFVGDLKHGRAARSLALLLAQFKNITYTFVSPPELAFESEVKAYVTEQGVSWTEMPTLEEGITHADVVYMTRIQKERFADSTEYERLKGRYVLTRPLVDGLKEKAIVMHPLPRVDEIHTEVDTSSKAVYFKQAGYGVALRMALLKHVLS